MPCVESRVSFARDSATSLQAVLLFSTPTYLFPSLPPPSLLPPSLPPLALGCVFMRVHKRGWSTCSTGNKECLVKEEGVIGGGKLEEMRRVPVRETAR